MTPPPIGSTGFAFGAFMLDTRRRALSVAGRPVTLSSRGFDILVLLVEQHDQVVSKDLMMTRVWQGVLVEENNLAVQISALRRALEEAVPGTGALILTVPGRGYRFVGEVTVMPGAATAVVPVAEAAGLDVVVAATGPVPRRRRAVWLVVPALVVVLAGVGSWFARWGSGEAAPRMSMVVMPFRALGADPGQGYLADAITDDLTTDLAHLPGSTVIARDSAEPYSGRGMTATAVGRALNVRYLLSGSLSHDDGAMHINATLVDAPRGVQLWSGTFDAPRGGLDDARTQIVLHLASVLDFAMTEIESGRSRHERPDNPDAVDLFLQARSRLDHDSGLAGLTAAQGLLEQTVAAAPGYSDALALLGLVLLSKIGDYDDPDEWRDHARAVTVIDAALALAPQNPLAVTARGKLAWEDDQCGLALPSFSLAVSLDPAAIAARDGLAQCDRDLGRIADMIGALQNLIGIDPAAPNSAARQNNIGMGYLVQGDLGLATTWLTRARAGEADPDAASDPLGWREWNRLYLIAAAWQSGDHDRARGLCEAYRRLYPRRTGWKLASYVTHALVTLPGYAAMLQAITDAGLPAFADEGADDGVAPGGAPHQGGDFDPTPLDIPGGRRITTGEMAALLGGPAPVRVLDLGRGAGAIPGAILVWPQGVWGDADQMLAEAAAAGSVKGAPALDQAIVVMGDGPLGWASYDGASRLVALGYRHVLWYRGGEEAWAAAGHRAEDRRAQ